ncbi:MAG: hypothetical protein IPP83_05905 [Flavobacteriales bacterium]|nr:hypothetical protein [Flavobacteriales bacterium]
MARVPSSEKANAMLNTICRENWNSMKSTENGRFCAKCQHTVVNFTGWDPDMIISYKREHPDVCGRYLAQQADPTLVPLADLLSPKRSVLAASLALSSLVITAQTPVPAPTEQVVPMISPTDPQSDDRSTTDPTDKPDGIHGTCPVPEDEDLQFEERDPRRLYVSRRFPFIHRHRRYLMGF